MLRCLVLERLALSRVGSVTIRPYQWVRRHNGMADMTGQMRRSRSCAAPYDGSNQQVLRVRRHAFLSLAFRFGSPALHYGCHARVRRGHGALLRLPFRTAYFGMRYCGYGGLAVASCGARHPRISQNRGISAMRHCCPIRQIVLFHGCFSTPRGSPAQLPAVEPKSPSSIENPPRPTLCSVPPNDTFRPRLAACCTV